MKLKNFPLRLDENFHRQIKVYCAQQGVSMQEFVQRVVEKELDKREQVVS